MQTFIVLLACLSQFLKCAVADNTICGARGSITPKKSQRTFAPNAWNGTDDGQTCITVNDDGTEFNVSWKWPTGRNWVHSYPSVSFLSKLLPLPLSSITGLTLSSTWSMSAQPDLKTAGAIANVAWDVWADTDEAKAKDVDKAGIEIMFWLGSEGPYFIQPLGYSKGPCAQETVNGVDFKLYCGTNSKNKQTFSWLSDSPLSSFNFDFNPLLQALVKANLLSSAVNVGIVQFGTEAFYSTENVTFAASNFGMNLTSNGTSPSGRSAGPKTIQSSQLLVAICLAISALFLW